jgi:hypothetical protein
MRNEATEKIALLHSQAIRRAIQDPTNALSRSALMDFSSIRSKNPIYQKILFDQWFTPANRGEIEENRGKLPIFVGQPAQRRYNAAGRARYCLGLTWTDEEASSVLVRSCSTPFA